MTMFSFNHAAMRPSSPARNPSTSSADRQPFAVRLAADALVIAGILALFGLIAWILPAIGEPIGPKGVPSSVSTNLADLPYYALRSVFRMFVALFFSLVFTFVYGTAAEENLAAICWAIVTMVAVVLLIDVLLWKPLTAWAEKFRITQSESAVRKTSAVLTIIRQSHIDEMLGRLFQPVGELFDTLTRPLGRTGGRWSVETKSARSRVLDVLFMVVVVAASAFGVIELMLVIHRDAGFDELGHALALGMLTFLRVALLTIVCSVIWVPVGALIGMNPRVSRFMQPIVQVLASFPSNFTFPFVTLWFVACSVNINWGSILLMALGTQWYILFNVIAGASQIPDDLREMAHSFQLGRWQRWRELILPAVFGSWVTGGITAAGGAWNASIVSEIVSYGQHTLTASGLGAYIAEATENGDTVRTIIGVAVMSVFVVAVNRLFWNPLQRLAERRFALN